MKHENCSQSPIRKECLWQNGWLKVEKKTQKKTEVKPKETNAEILHTCYFTLKVLLSI